jgi:competence protein ComEC
MRGIFFYLSILAFTSGIFVRSLFSVGWVVIAWIGLLTVVLGLWWYRARPSASAPALLMVIVVGVCFTVGLARLELDATLQQTSALTSMVGAKVELTGLVVAEPEITAKSTRLVVEVEEERILVSTDRYAEVVYGDAITFTGKLQKPESFETEFGRTFNYPGYLAVRDIFYTVSFANISVVDKHQGNTVIAWLLTGKHYFLQSIQKYIPEPEVGLGAGLLLGIKSSLGDELEDAFRTTGIIHIVVLSGTNIMLVVIFVMYVLALFFPVRPRAVIGMVAIILFALLVGLSATVVRASIMASLILLALFLGRHYVIMRALFFAGALMLLIDPLLLVYDVGFQLSFLATLGLILVAPQFELFLSGVSSKFKLKEYFLATVATQIAILPLLLYQIGQFSVVAVIVNMLVLPIVAVAMLATFLTGIVGFILPPLATVLGVIAYGFLVYIISIATWFAALPFAAFVVPEFPFVIMVFMYVLIGFGVYKLSHRANTGLPVIDFSEIEGWTIVEEEALQENQNTKERTSAVRPDKDITPIFFR